MIRAMLDLAEATEQAAEATKILLFGLVKLDDARRRVEEHGTRYNHGRARKVSFRRPSPQMSRKQLEDLWTKEYLAEPIEWERKVIE